MALFQSCLDYVLVRLIDLIKLLIHNFIIRRFALPVLFLDILEVVQEISPSDLVLRVAAVEPLPL